MTWRAAPTGRIRVLVDVSATKQMHSNSPVLAIEEAGGHSPSLVKAGGCSSGLRRYVGEGGVH